MKRPCPICGKRPVVYSGAQHCSYDCWEYSLGGGVLKEPEVIEVPEETTCLPRKKYVQLSLV